MRPSPVLCRRVKSRHAFTTKEVGKGFYRGSGTGSMGAHTRYGGYLIDWRKTRHFVVPDLRKCKLTPFVRDDKSDLTEPRLDPDNKPYYGNYDGLQYLAWLRSWKPELWQDLMKREAEHSAANMAAEEEDTIDISHAEVSSTTTQTLETPKP